jgi:hypothetical protein
MMSGWVRYLRLTAEAKTGLSTQILIWSAVAALCAVFTFFFVILAAFIWLAERYSALTAALILAGLFLLLAIGAAIVCILTRQRTIERAQLALATRSNAPWMDPRILGIGLQIGRSIGWKRIVPLAAVGVLAAGFAKEWFGRDKPADEEQSEI